ncbi:SAM-dependent methyltransferase [Saccharopolyspora sp. K220]|uniref:SAM-dependent methyltransferase n=1 Tax=Saccharopolyspora soli TaxID=2926618 RepID=UPI001F57B1D3|nr:SAM-dependent methyltransferase [Saccharopolyspora soli]MCI2418985.1 SAM-dependent methyltransferase [Saccharopolyspora soli]
MTRTGGERTGVPGGIDSTRPSSARVYDAILGGKDNYAADRVLRDELAAVTPKPGVLASVSRAFLLRVTRYLASTANIDQFLDCGSGLPTLENTHEVAQRVNPDATVVYVDNDPTAIVHGRALLAENDSTHFVAADITEPDKLLAEPAVTRGLEWTRPIALYVLNTLHHISADHRLADLMARYINTLPSGSYVALTHFCRPGPEDPEASELADKMESAYLNSMGTGWFRSRDEIASYFGGLELLEPGLVTVAEWWPDGPRENPLEPFHRVLVGGVARKP